MTQPRIWIGVDPGTSGAIAAITEHDGQRIVETIRLAETPRDVWTWVSMIREATPGERLQGAIEKVSARPGQGTASMFKFGASYGFCRGVLVAAAIPFREVTPQKWQRGLGVRKRSKDEPGGAHKRRLKELAQSLYPEVAITLAEADAVLIAEWLRRQETHAAYGKER